MYGERVTFDEDFAVRMLVRSAHRMEHRYPVRWPSPGATRPRGGTGRPAHQATSPWPAGVTAVGNRQDSKWRASGHQWSTGRGNRRAGLSRHRQRVLPAVCPSRCGLPENTRPSRASASPSRRSRTSSLSGRTSVVSRSRPSSPDGTISATWSPCAITDTDSPCSAWRTISAQDGWSSALPGRRGPCPTGCWTCRPLQNRDGRDRWRHEQVAHDVVPGYVDHCRLAPALQGRAGHAVAGQNLPLDELGMGLSGYLFDDGAEKFVAQVGVGRLVARWAGQLDAREDVGQPSTPDPLLCDR